MSQSPPQETVSRLKALLFDREARELDTLNTRLAEMQKRAGSDEQFQKSVAKVLDSALREAEVTRHRELADAMAPMVLRTLRTEMKSPEMQDQIAGVMYPRMGEMVARYVSSAIRDMMQEINRRLESGLTHNRFFLWVRSMTSGRSMAELALAATQRLEVKEIYLVRRGSGALVHHWRRSGSADPPDGANRDTLVSGFLAAITALAEDAFEADKESLRTLDLDDHRIYLRGSPDYLLAAKCSGSAPSGIDRNLDAELIQVLIAHRELERASPTPGDQGAVRDAGARLDQLLATFSERIEEAAHERAQQASRASGGRTLKVLLWIVGLPLATFAAWYVYVGFITHALQTKADGAIAAIPSLRGYPVRAHVERGAHRIWVAGLAPDEPTRRLLLGNLEKIAPEVELTEAIGVLPKPDVQAKLDAEGFRRSVERAQSKLTALMSDLATAREHGAGTPTADPLALAERSAETALLELQRPRPAAEGDRPDPGIASALAGLEAATDKLSIVVGAEKTTRLPAPQDATSGAEAIALATERIAVLIGTIEQRRTVAPIAERTAEVDRLAEERVTALDRRYRERLSELERRLSQLSPATPRQRLETFVRANALFFGTDADYRDANAAGRVLDEVVALARQADATVRVVGYTDEAGGPTRNAPLAQARADRVVADLVSRGHPRNRLIPVGRPSALPLAPGAGADSPNRRVEFELAFMGERSNRP